MFRKETCPLFTLIQQDVPLLEQYDKLSDPYVPNFAKPRLTHIAERLKQWLHFGICISKNNYIAENYKIAGIRNVVTINCLYCTKIT